ncbi:MAG: hypothetical protein M1820_009857 [Bogoriella megaspora]|nr:MAG: hypothetical protein M1820_009857 [Bogoriella megaspora]
MSQESYSLAGRLVRRFPSKAIELIVQHIEKQNILDHIQRACNVEGKNFYKFMSEDDACPSSHSLLASHTSDTHHYRSSQMENPTAPLSPPSSIQGSSLDQGISLHKQNVSQGIDEFVEVVGLGSNRRTFLSVKNIAGSHNLINQDVNFERLRSKPQQLGAIVHVQHNDGLLPVSSYASFSYQRDGRLTTEEHDFFLVPRISTDLVIGKLSSKDVFTQLSNGPSSPNHAHGEVIQPVPKVAHGFPMQPHDSAQSVGGSSHEESTLTTISSPATIRGPCSGPESGQQRTRALSAISRSSPRPRWRPTQIPRPPTSPASSTGSASHRTASTTQVPPSHAAQNSRTAELVSVRIKWGRAQTRKELDLRQGGEDFHNFLEHAMTELGRSLDRAVQYVRFTMEDKAGADCIIVHLQEHCIGQDWDDTVEWIENGRHEARRGFYAMIGQADLVFVRPFSLERDVLYIPFEKWDEFLREPSDRQDEQDLFEHLLAIKSDLTRVAVPEALLQNGMISTYELNLYHWKVKELLIVADPQPDLLADPDRNMQPSWEFEDSRSGAFSWNQERQEVESRGPRCADEEALSAFLEGRNKALVAGLVQNHGRKSEVRVVHVIRR